MRSDAASWRLSLLLPFLVLGFAGPIVHHMGEQQASRLAFTAAVWDHQTLRIDRYEEILGRDRAVVEDVTYSDKAPAQPLLAVPFYAGYRAVGGEPADVPRKDGNLGLWWLTLWSATLPIAALSILMYRWSVEVAGRWSWAAAFAVTFGTLLLPYASLLFGHALTAMLAFLMFLLARRPAVSSMKLVAAGMVGGLAVLVEYPTALVVAVVTVVALVRHRFRAGLIVIGGLGPALAMLWYNDRLFGGPLVFPYQWSAWTAVRDEASDLSATALQQPALDSIIGAFTGQRGLILATPIVILAMFFIPALWRRSWFDGAVVAGVVVVMLLFVSTRGNAYAGGPGPRYVFQMLPFLAAPLALAWQRYRRLSLAAAGISVVTMAAATVTEPQLGPDFDAGLGFWLSRLFVGWTADTVYTLAVGGVGWLFHIGLVALIVWRVRPQPAR